MKKYISIFLAICMMLLLFAGCANSEAEVGGQTATPAPSATDSGKNTEPSAEPEPEPEPEETAEINVIIWGLAGVPTEEALAKVNERLNEITIPKINVKVNFQIWDTGTYVGQAAVVIASGEDVDLMCTFPAAAAHFTPMSAQNMLLPLDDLLQKHCKELLETVPSSFFEATTVNGEIVAVPVLANKVNSQYWVARKAIFDELGFKEENVKTLDDIYNVLKACKEKYPNMLPLSGDNLTLDFTYPGFELTTGNYFDPLGDSSAVAAVVQFDKTGKTDFKVVNRYETQEWFNITSVLQKWYRENLIDKDAITYNGAGWALQRDKNVFSAIRVTNIVSAKLLPQQAGEDVVVVKLMDGSLTTGGLIQMTWALPVTCDEPDAAAKFLNLLYTDAEIVNLLNYGIEGEHYVKQADGTIDYPAGITMENAPYNPGFTDYLGNSFLAYVRKGTNPEIQKESYQIMMNATTSPLLGFKFDTAPVSDIYTQLSSICHDEYGPTFFCGAAPDGYQDEFIAKLYSVGLQEFLDEAQRQVDAWLKTKGYK